MIGDLITVMRHSRSPLPFAKDVIYIFDLAALTTYAVNPRGATLVEIRL